MKLAFLVALLLISFTNSYLFRVPEAETPIFDRDHSCISDYWTGLFAHFDLDQPKLVLSCFDKKSTGLYFKQLYEVSKLVQDAENRNRIQVHLDFAKLAVLHKALEDVMTCVGHSKDFSDLLDALKIKHFDHERTWLASFIYYQAHFGKLAEEFPQITKALDDKDCKKAGDLKGALINTTVNEVRTQGLSLLALNGLWNGVHIALGLPDAESVISCWNNDTATLRLEFIYGMSVAVANGKADDAAENTEKWYNQTGKDLINKIPTSAWKCWSNSTDTKSESEKLKIDITSKEFYQRVAKFVDTQKRAYWHLQSTIKSSLEQHNFIHAGSAYGHLLQAAVATN